MSLKLARAATVAAAAWFAVGPANAQPSAQGGAASAPTAPAAPVDAAGAAALAKALMQTLTALSGQAASGQAASGQAAADNKLPAIFSGPPVVMPMGDHYVAALPSVSARGDDGSRVDIGSVWLTLRPFSDGTFSVSIKLPGSLTFMKEGDPAAVATLGEQKIEGTWSPKLATFLTFDASIADFQVTSVYDDYWFGIEAISLKQDLKPERDAKLGWSGPSALSLTEMRLDKGDETLFSVAEMTAESVYSRVRLESIAQIVAMAEAAAASGVEPDPHAIFRLLSQIVGGATSRVQVSNISVIDPDSKQAVAFDKAVLTMGVADLDKEMASLDFGVEVVGLSLDPAPADESVLPKDADMRMSLHNVPIAALLKLGEATATGAAAGDPTVAALQAFDKAKTTVKLDSLGAKTSLLQGHASGEAVAAQASALGAVAKAKATLSGVDALIASLQPKKKNAKPDPANAELLGALTMLKAMGRPEKDKNGKTALTYTFEMTPQGVFLLNDTDLAPLLEGGK